MIYTTEYSKNTILSGHILFILQQNVDELLIMSLNDYSSLRVLIVDDFHNFRRALSKNMYDLGFRHIDTAGSGEEAISFFRKQRYDLILSDYNLGSGKNGQQLLEELRASHYIRSGDIFMLVSADTSRNVVMCSYDCEPDAFLTKPITGKVLEQRVKRLVARRVELADVYFNLEKNDIEKAVFLLNKHIHQQSRYAVDCQKLLGELYLKNKQFDRAEELYSKVLLIRELDWALVGLANVKMEQGETELALHSLERIVSANPSYLKAYDSLSKGYAITGDSENLQKVLEKAIEVSPMSTARQKNLAQTALHNGDVELAMKAYKRTIKYGANSHHDTPDNHLNFARSVTKIFDNNVDKAKEFSREAAILLNNLEDKYDIDCQQKLQAKLINSQIHALDGNEKKSIELLSEAKVLMESVDEKNIDTDIEIVNALIANDKKLEANTMLAEMVEFYKDDQSALEKIDPLLNEPVSNRGKATIAKINKKGISAYQQKNYVVSIDFFTRAQKKFPRYIGLKLNLIQAMIGFMKDEEVNDEYVDHCHSIFKVIERYISSTSPQFSRYKQLQTMLRQVTLKQH